jgi:hypothetical protein
VLGRTSQGKCPILVLRYVITASTCTSVHCQCSGPGAGRLDAIQHAVGPSRCTLKLPAAGLPHVCLERQPDWVSAFHQGIMLASQGLSPSHYTHNAIIIGCCGSSYPLFRGRPDNRILLRSTTLVCCRSTLAAWATRGVRFWPRAAIFHAWVCGRHEAAPWA